MDQTEVDDVEGRRGEGHEEEDRCELERGTIFDKGQDRFKLVSLGSWCRTKKIKVTHRSLDILTPASGILRWNKSVIG